MSWSKLTRLRRVTWGRPSYFWFDRPQWNERKNLTSVHHFRWKLTSSKIYRSIFGQVYKGGNLEVQAKSCLILECHQISINVWKMAAYTTFLTLKKNRIYPLSAKVCKNGQEIDEKIKRPHRKFSSRFFPSVQFLFI